MGGGFIVATLAMIKATNTKRVMLSNLTNFINGFFEIAVVYLLSIQLIQVTLSKEKNLMDVSLAMSRPK